jgi:outer membrane lipoprotein-sorting protein
MKLFVVLLALSLPLLARADTKSEGILKEVQLRMKNVTTYSVTMTVQDGKDRGKLCLFVQRPDKYRLSIDISFVIKGKMVVPLPTDKEEFDMFLKMASGNFEEVLKDVDSTTYVTQKMLDENTLVDVIDIKGKKPGDSVRLYIDNNSLIYKMVAKNVKKDRVMLFINPEIDEPIPAETFAITESKK